MYPHTIRTELLQGVDKAQIRIRSKCRRSMAETFGNGLNIISGQESIFGVRMAEILESGIRNASLVPSHQM